MQDQKDPECSGSLASGWSPWSDRGNGQKYFYPAIILSAALSFVTGFLRFKHFSTPDLSWRPKPENSRYGIVDPLHPGTCEGGLD